MLDGAGVSSLLGPIAQCLPCNPYAWAETLTLVLCSVQVDDMVNSNSILYSSGEHPDHVVVIKYVPYVADSKRAMDEYTSEIFMGGRNTIALHNTCEDSLLAAPILLDLVILPELLTRIQVRPSLRLPVLPLLVPA